MSLTGIVGRVAYAALVGIVVFLLVLAVGFLILHFITSSDGQTYGNEVKGLAVLIGFLAAIAWFFSHRAVPPVA